MRGLKFGRRSSKPVDYDGEVTLDHFKLGHTIGEGAFGKVRLLLFVSIWSDDILQVRIVAHNRIQKVYALKYIDKARCIQQTVMANFIREQRLLEEVRLCHSSLLQFN